MSKARIYTVVVNNCIECPDLECKVFQAEMPKHDVDLDTTILPGCPLPEASDGDDK